MRAASRTERSSRSRGPRPFSVSIDSITSSALPTSRPSGASIDVRSASVRTPEELPTCTRAWARRLACAVVFMKAPRPALTSRTSASIPSAIFLLMIEAVISGMLSTVEVTSRSA